MDVLSWDNIYPRILQSEDRAEARDGDWPMAQLCWWNLIVRIQFQLARILIIRSQLTLSLVNRGISARININILHCIAGAKECSDKPGSTNPNDKGAPFIQESIYFKDININCIFNIQLCLLKFISDLVVPSGRNVCHIIIICVNMSKI